MSPVADLSAGGVAGPQSASTDGHRRFAKQAVGVLGFVIFVILFGAVVRITGSGAGCGQHWPTCQGEVAHLPQRLDTVIELTHRLTSGLSMLAVFALGWMAHRRFKTGHPVRWVSYGGVVFIIIEALIGAGLVLFGLVGDNDSLARAVVMSAHLVNTSLLTGCLALAAYFAIYPAPSRRQLRQKPALWTTAALLGLMLVTVSGAVTALGDTLFPAGSEMARTVSAAYSGTAHILERLRVAHPLLAVLGAGGVIAVTSVFALPSSSPISRKLARATLWTTGIQLAVGTLNILLLAPGWLQVVHLALATILWILLVLTWMAVAAPPYTGAQTPEVACT